MLRPLRSQPFQGIPDAYTRLVGRKILSAPSLYPPRFGEEGEPPLRRPKLRRKVLRRRAKSPGAKYSGASFELYCLEILSPSAEQGEGGEYHKQGEKAASSCRASASAATASSDLNFEGTDIVAGSLGAGNSPLVH